VFKGREFGYGGVELGVVRIGYSAVIIRNPWKIDYFPTAL
jgi:hypothetical protein